MDRIGCGGRNIKAKPYRAPPFEHESAATNADPDTKGKLVVPSTVSVVTLLWPRVELNRLYEWVRVRVFTDGGGSSAIRARSIGGHHTE